MSAREIDDGGPAFGPTFVLIPSDIRHEDAKDVAEQLARMRKSMSLRDYFAGQALAGGCASDTEEQCGLTDMAEWAYRQADAMLKARAE